MLLKSFLYFIGCFIYIAFLQLLLQKFKERFVLVLDPTSDGFNLVPAAACLPDNCDGAFPNYIQIKKVDTSLLIRVFDRFDVCILKINGGMRLKLYKITISSGQKYSVNHIPLLNFLDACIKSVKHPY